MINDIQRRQFKQTVENMKEAKSMIRTLLNFIVLSISIQSAFTVAFFPLRSSTINNSVILKSMLKRPCIIKDHLHSYDIFSILDSIRTFSHSDLKLKYAFRPFYKELYGSM